MRVGFALGLMFSVSALQGRGAAFLLLYALTNS